MSEPKVQPGRVTDGLRPSIETVFARCQDAIPSWRGLAIDDVDFDEPKGFSSFTIGVRPRVDTDPAAVLYRQLAGKDNAILDSAVERSAFLALGDAGIAARCLHVDDECRIEEFFTGAALTAADVFDTDVQRAIAVELHRLHRLEPPNLPDETFFELLHVKWGALARSVLERGRTELPSDERVLCDQLDEMLTADTHRKVMRCLPDREPVFCHNDTYHGNVFRHVDGRISLLDFEFSCRNHIAFDFANLFAETVMEHGLVDPPHFRIGEPRFGDDDLASLIGHYLDQSPELDDTARAAELERLVEETRRAVMLSDYMYAMAAIPLALEPIQKIRFVPYAHQRFEKFLRTWDAEFAP